MAKRAKSKKPSAKPRVKAKPNTTREIDSIAIRVSGAVLEEIKSRGAFQETPDAVLRRVFNIPPRLHWKQRAQR